MFPIVYILATLFVTIVPMYASPVETGEQRALPDRTLAASHQREINASFCYRLRLSSDILFGTGVSRVHRVEKQTKVLP